MARFTLPRDIYHGKGCLEELKNLKGYEMETVLAGEDGWNPLKNDSVK
jgi:hypothetical protein